MLLRVLSPGVLQQAGGARGGAPMGILPETSPPPACAATWAFWEQPWPCLASLGAVLVPLVYVLGLMAWLGWREKKKEDRRRQVSGDGMTAAAPRCPGWRCLVC